MNEDRATEKNTKYKRLYRKLLRLTHPTHSQRSGVQSTWIKNAEGCHIMVPTHGNRCGNDKGRFENKTVVNYNKRWPRRGRKREAKSFFSFFKLFIIFHLKVISFNLIIELALQVDDVDVIHRLSMPMCAQHWHAVRGHGASASQEPQLPPFSLTSEARMCGAHVTWIHTRSSTRWPSGIRHKNIVRFYSCASPSLRTCENEMNRFFVCVRCFAVAPLECRYAFFGSGVLNMFSTFEKRQKERSGKRIVVEKNLRTRARRKAWT